MDPFSVLDEFRACRTPQEVGGVLSRVITQFGFDTYAIGALPTESDPNPTGFTVHNWPEEWGKRYFERGYAAHDPIPRAVMTCAMPLTVAEMMAGKAGFVPSPEAHLMMEDAASLGRSVGLVVPIAGPHGYHGIVVICGDGPEPDARTKAILHLWAIYAHDRMLALHGRTPLQSRPNLTAREVEVLRLARNGLSDDGIASNLGITVRTVRFHFDNARQRLGGNSRAETLILASNYHLLGA